MDRDSQNYNESMQSSNIPGYEITGSVSRSGSTVYSAVRKTDNTPVIIKTPGPNVNSAAIEHEYNVIHSLRGPDIILAYDLLKMPQIALVLEHFNGLTVKAYIKTGLLSMETRFDIAIKCAEALERIHKKGVIHRDINPSNILYNPDDNCIKIIDFTLATFLPPEMPEATPPDLLEGTLAYIAPEQTGRMDRGIDQRSDLYSLGITFYELLSGHLPFSDTDSLSLIYDHMTKSPKPPHLIEPRIPPVMSDIILKLTAKNAEDRYQSAAGLLEDLKYLLNIYRSEGKVEPFPLGRSDRTGTLRISEKLYGREQEIADLTRAFEHIATGKRELLLVSGFSGVGKTRLVREVQKPITERRGYFISGKFDQYHKSIPYSAIIDAFRQLFKQLLTQPEAILKQSAVELSASVSPNESLLIEMIPEIELVIGSRQKLELNNPIEVQNRLQNAFESMLKVVSTRDRPLVIFLDDLQWADIASLTLIEKLVSSTDIAFFLFIGAYRDNEVSDSHPLSVIVNELKREEKPVHTIHLKPLSRDNVSQMICDSLGTDQSKSETLIDALYERTRGNPFFLIQYLRDLNRKNIIHFNESLNIWTWDLDMIQQGGISDNIVSLLVESMSELPKKSQEVLKVGSCMGIKFTFNELLEQFTENRSIIASSLMPPIKNGMILIQGQNSRSMEEILLSINENSTNQLIIRFSHDRIHQAAYALLSEEEKEELHLKLARSIRPNIENDESLLFDVVKHYTRIIPFVKKTDQRERDDVINLFVRAGKKARISAAYDTAYNFFSDARILIKAGTSLLTTEFSFEVERDFSECAYLTGRFQEAEKVFDTLLSEAPTELKKVEIYSLILTLQINRGDFHPAIQTGNKALALFGESFPESPEELEKAKVAELERIKTNLSKVSNIEDILNHPVLDDPGIAAVMRILMDLGIPAFISKKELFPVIGLRMVNLSLEKGNCDASPYGYAFYGMILSTHLGDYQGGFKFGTLALQLHEKYYNGSYTCKIYRIYGAYIDSWKKPLREGIDHLWKAYHSGIDTGDLIYAGYSLNHIFIRRFMVTDSLRDLEDETRRGLDFFVRTKDKGLHLLQMMLLQIVKNLQGETDGPDSIKGEYFDEDKTIQYMTEKNVQTVLAYYHTYKLQLACIYGNYSKALYYARMAEPFLDNMIGNILEVEWTFYYSIALLKAEDDKQVNDVDSPGDIENPLDEFQKKLETWGENAPDNFSHKAIIIKALRVYKEGDLLQANEQFENAANIARQKGFFIDEAICYELVADIWFQNNKNRIGMAYLLEAYNIYNDMGALGKSATIVKYFPALQTKMDVYKGRTVKEFLDYDSLLRASRTLSSTIQLPELLKGMLQVVTENSGAQKSILLLFNEGALTIEATKSYTTDANIIESLPIEQVPLSGEMSLPIGIINYVARTGETIILDDAFQEGRFITETYFTNNRTRSVMALPIRHHQRPVAILYMENNLTSGVFTERDKETAEILGSQLAVSLENAHFYKTQEERVNAEVQRRKDQEELLFRQSKFSAMGEMLANIAHHWRQPLNSLGLLIQALPEMYDDGELNRDNLKDTVDQSMKLIFEMSGVINDFSALFRKEENKISFKVSDTIMRTATFVDSLFKREFIKLTINQKADGEIYGFPGEFSQAILNLLDNSREALEKSDYLIRRVIIDVDRTIEGKISVSITDNGGGIEPEQIDRIFEPYFTTKFKAAGTGLGLYRSRKIIEDQMGGTIRVKNIILENDEGESERCAQFTIEI